jgi:predicted GIY-YIG superfamily endonuclease
MQSRPRIHLKKRRDARRAAQRAQFVVYGLENGLAGDRDHYTYVGMTNDMRQRLRRHNGEITGGARYTHNIKLVTGQPWRLLFLVSGFPSARAARQLEWRMHQRKLGVPNLGRSPFDDTASGKRAWQLFSALAMEHVTSTAPRTADMELQIMWRSNAYMAQARACPRPWPARVTHVSATALRAALN